MTGTWYIVNITTGERVPVRGDVVAIDYNALSNEDRDTFDSGNDKDIAEMATRNGWTLDLIEGATK